MPPKTFDEVLAGAKNLAPEDRQRLIAELARTAPPDETSVPETENGEIRTLFDALNARGLIGCIKDAPPDLSTNPKYMEGFGRDAG